jgi:hypothetical protein
MSERTSRIQVWIGVAALVLAACGGGDGAGSGDTTPTTGSGSGSGGTSGTVESGQASSGGQGGDATATLTIEDQVHTWAAEDMTDCSIGGIFPASAEFGVPPSQGGEGPWVQFIDRGDGGINFSALIDGEEYSGTGSGEADEIRSDGFSYTGMMGSNGQRLDVVLEVFCG